MEYYGYKPKDIDKSYIDWAGITKGISEEIRGVAKDRQNQRNELEKEHFKQLQALNEFEQGMDPSANNVILRAGQGSRDLLTQLNRQMKAGLKTPEEVKIIQQNISDNFSSLNNTLKAVNTQIQSLAEAEGKGNEAVIDEIRRIINLGENTIVPDPETGELFLVGKKDDGNIDSSTARPLRALSNIVGQKFDYVDVEAESKKIADDAGVWKQTFANGLTIEDARKNPDYSSWIFNVVKSKMNTDEKMASVLLDYDNQEYTTTGEEGKIQLEFDRSVGKMVPKLTDAQRERAKHVFEHAIEAKIGAVRTEAKEEKLTAGEKEKMDVVKSLDRFLSSGDKTDLDAVFSAAGVNDYQFIDDELRLNVRDKQGNLTSRTVIPINEGMSNVQLGNAIAGKIGITNYKDKTTLSSEQQSEITYDPSKLSGIISENTAAQKLGKVSARSDGELLRSFKEDSNGNPATPEGIASAARLVGLDLGIPTENIKILDDGVSLEVNGVNLGDPTLLDAATVKSKIISTISTQGGSSDDFINLTKNAINSNK